VTRARVFHDGGCPLCNLEINALKAKGVQFDFVDVTAQDFDATILHTDQATAEYWLHWVDAEGRVYQGYEANLQMWRAAGYRFVRFAEHPWVAPVGRLVYVAFAKFRGPLGRAYNFVGNLLAKAK